MAPSYLENLGADLLDAGAEQAENFKAEFVAFVEPQADKSIDALAAAAKQFADKALGKFGAALFAASVDHAIDNADAQAKAAVGPEADKFVDFIAAGMRAEAAKLRAL